MWIKHLLLLSLISFSFVKPTHSASCDDWLFLCEHDSIFVNDSISMKPIRMPLESSNCKGPGTTGVCITTLRALEGQKILVKTGIFFGVGPRTSPCDSDRHVAFASQTSDLSKSDRKCGRIDPYTQLFESASEEMTIEYRSSSVDDGAVISVEAFGCSMRSFVSPNEETILELPDLNYGPEDNEYEAMVRCREGYLMDGFADSSPIVCRKSNLPSVLRQTWDWNFSADKYTCNRITCEQLMPPANGQYELSNGLYHMSTATFNCGIGYALEGNSTQLCKVAKDHGGYWEGTTPTCKIADCGPPQIMNASYNPLTTTTYQTMFTYLCDDGMLPLSSHANCMANGHWSYTPCQAIACPLPQVDSGWVKVSSSKFANVGETLLYSCIHDDSVASITCKMSENGKTGVWTSLEACRKTASFSPIERMEAVDKAPKKQPRRNDQGAIVGGVVAGLIFSVIIILIACVLVRKSAAKRRNARNNNNKEEELKKLRDPLSTDRPLKPKRLRYEIGSPQPIDTDVEKSLCSDPEPEYAAVVKHYKNRGNDRFKNGVNGTNRSNNSNVTNGTTRSSHSNGTNGTNRSNNSNGIGGTERSHKGSVSHKSSGSASSVELIETGDLYDSVINGGGTSFNGTPQQPVETSPTDQGTLTRIENELNESQVNGVMGPNKQKSHRIYEDVKDM